MSDIDVLTSTIIEVAIGIHRDIGPGLFESVYERLLAASLEKRGLRVERQLVVRFEYDGIAFDEGFRVDLLVDGRVVVEVKSVPELALVHGKQVLTYLRLMQLPVGLLINFGAPTLKEGLRRLVNDHKPGSTSLLRVNRPVPGG
jgi:iron complex transport system substrate-binding protein